MLLAGCHRGPKQPSHPAGAGGDSVPPVEDTLVDDGEEFLQEPEEQLWQWKWHNLGLRRDSSDGGPRRFSRKQNSLFGPRRHVVVFDSTLMYGEWQCRSEHEQYLADGTGFRWDTDDDVHRDEAQKFRWTMHNNLLTLHFTQELGGLVIAHYVVTGVDDKQLVYRDDYGTHYVFDKLPADFTDRPQ